VKHVVAVTPGGGVARLVTALVATPTATKCDDNDAATHGCGMGYGAVHITHGGTSNAGGELLRLVG